jgi:hypothetical protein
VPAAVDSLYIGLEGEAGVARRVEALREQGRYSCGRLRVILNRLDVRDAKDRAALVTAVRDSGFTPAVIVIDTLARAAPGADENSAADMGEIIAALSELQRDLGGFVLAVHHAGKDAARGLRGHSSLGAALDVVIECIREGGRREWKVGKAKDGEDGAVHPFELQRVELGATADGLARTSCVIEPGQVDNTPRRAPEPTGANQRVALGAIKPLLTKSADFGKGGAPSYRPCVTVAAALDAVSAHLACDPKRRRERASSALTSLSAHGHIRMAHDWVWLP